MPSEQRTATVKVVVATTVMLSFISFWRAAAIVLSDLASSAYYVGGIAETAIGKSAPWFILAIMLFSYAVRAIYIESCQHVRARRRVQGGPRSHGRDAGQVLRLRPDVRLRSHRADQSASARAYTSAGLINEISENLHQPGLHVHPPYFAAVFAAAVTLYFWRKNIMGIHESSEKALRIMQITTVMVVDPDRLVHRHDL